MGWVAFKCFPPFSSDILMVQVSGFQDRLPLELACDELPQEAPKESTSRSHPFIQLLVSHVLLEFSPREHGERIQFDEHIFLY